VVISYFNTLIVEIVDCNIGLQVHNAEPPVALEVGGLESDSALDVLLHDSLLMC
jgi:hypothetical protein